MPVYYSSIWLSVYLATWLSDHLTIYLFSFFIYLFIDLRIWLSIHLTIYLAISVYLAIDRSIYLFIELSLKLSISVAICLMQGSMWQHWSCLSPSSKNPRLVPRDEIQSLYPFFLNPGPMCSPCAQTLSQQMSVTDITAGPWIISRCHNIFFCFYLTSNFGF